MPISNRIQIQMFPKDLVICQESMNRAKTDYMPFLPVKKIWVASLMESTK